MSSDRIIDELAALRYPMDTDYGPDDSLNVRVQTQREEYARELRARRDHPIHEIAEPDPVLGALRRATFDVEIADLRRRELIAYAREVLPGRGYSLEDIAEACHMSPSGVRTAYLDRHVDTARKLIAHTTDTTDKEED